MTVTERLLASSDDELELALLGAAQEELPTAVGLHDTAVALGLTTATAAALAAALPTSAAPLGASASVGSGSLGMVSGALPAAAPPAAGASVATAGAASLATLGKAVVGGALASFALLSGVEHLASSPAATTAAPLVAPVTAPSSTAPLRERIVSPGASEERPALLVASPPPSASVRASVRRSAPLGPSDAVEATPLGAPRAQASFDEEAPQRAQGGADASLAEETRLLEQARVALDRGDTRGARARLAEYGARRPSGVLAQEAGLLEVRLLLATGQRVAAAEHARALISRYPESAHAQSLRRLAAEQP